MGQKLMTKALAATMPPLYANEEVPDPMVRAKFFTPWAGATWLVTEYNPETRIIFGWATLGDPECAELGYTSLDELESLIGPFGLKVERDIHFTPKPLSAAIRQLVGPRATEEGGVLSQR